MRACFDPREGHGYTLCRVHMNSCDFALGNYAHVEQAGDLALKQLLDRTRPTGTAAHDPGRAAHGRPATEAAGVTLEPPGLDEGHGPHERRRQALARVPRGLGAVLRALHPRLRGRRRAGVGCLGAERTRSAAALGFVPVYRRGRARLRARPPRASLARRRTGPCARCRVGPQPRRHGRACQRDLWRRPSCEVHLGHRLSLVHGRPLRPRAVGARRLARQATAVHRRLPGRRSRTGAAGSWPSAMRAR
jgi:hypothetical protein